MIWIERIGIKVISGKGTHTNSISYIPPYSPEINTIEKEWGWLSQNKLANRCPYSNTVVVDCVCGAWSLYRK
ncbi:transposase [Vibrio sp. B1FLJ16]|uniref:transposase n=1 Tax=Vibrio sp. B1FLJ16 TaxID=2751178 RepID=UPI0015F492AC